MKTYKIVIGPEPVNDFILGRISGEIYVLTGMPKREYPWKNILIGWTITFEANKKQARAIYKHLNNVYSKFSIHMWCVE